MKKTINKTVYNTETAKKLGHFAEGFFGDPSGFEEILYITKKGKYFTYGIGGETSKYPTETIKELTEKEAEDWIAEHPAQ